MSLGARAQTRLLRSWWKPRRDALAWALLPLEAGYRTALALRTAVWHASGRPAPRLSRPVVVVGNLVAGGAGKTPTVIALVEALRAAGHRPGVVTRGHGRAQADTTAEVLPSWAEGLGDAARRFGDEPVLLRRRTSAPVVVGRDRPAAVRALLAAHPGVSVVIADDGLQHLRLERRIAIVVIDERGAGNRACLPAGPLRAPLPAHPRDGWCVLHNAPSPALPWAGGRVQRSLRWRWPLAAWQAGDTTARVAIAAGDATAGWTAAAGIAAPERFFTMLEAAGLRIARRLPLPDHAALAPPPWSTGEAVVVTEKDAVKLDPAAPQNARVQVAPLDFVLPSELVAAVRAAIGPPA